MSEGGDGGDDADGAAITASTEVEASSELGSIALDLARIAATGAAHPPIARGTVIDGAYRIERAIGEGGMGVVYLARDVRLERDVAIKLGSSVSTAALARAGREALALARLSHPNVVAVFQIGEVGGRLYIAMEHVAGGNARQWVAASSRGWREIVALYAAAGDGLAAAHAAGLVHRDVKPDNVLVGDDGRPRVADFGLARGAVSTDGAPDAAMPSSESVTQTGTILGTPAYMAPEQLAGEDLDPRADQFSFCASLWEALFGTRPFAGKTPQEIGAAIARGEPRPEPTERARRVPRHVIAALVRGLHRDRDQRWPS
jgi:serine/threonine protein kinase